MWQLAVELPSWKVWVGSHCFGCWRGGLAILSVGLMLSMREQGRMTQSLPNRRLPLLNLLSVMLRPERVPNWQKSKYALTIFHSSLVLSSSQQLLPWFFKRFLYLHKRPWKALLFPIKLKWLNISSLKIFMTPSFYGKFHIVQLCYCYIAAKSPFCFTSILLPRSIGSKRNPITLKHMDPLFLPRHYL